MFKEDKILLVSELGVEGLSLLAKLALDFDVIVWVSSNTYLPSKILNANSYRGKAKVFGFHSKTGNVVDPLNLNEISLKIHEESLEKACVIISCLSELIMHHGIKKIHTFLVRLLNSTKRLLCMLIDEAQDRRDELLISALFDAVFKLKRVGSDKVVLVPILHYSPRVMELEYRDGVIYQAVSQ